MKITLDTNVLVSAFISKKGHCAKILDIVIDFEEVDLVLSEEILNEFKDVLSREEVKRRFNYTRRDVENFVKTIKDVAIIVKIESNFKVIKKDPKDDLVLNTGYDGKVDYIISGDHHLKDLKEFKGIKIIKPKEMVDVFIRKFGEFLIPIERIETIGEIIIIKKKEN